ncbi:lysozyme family protein [Klebsiella aerogenes]|uniref:hypothetical protein n=1 Tax=Klebsiella aerogenes TaxID=548 RepID=UPI000DA217C9|nr:hypothetical protein [Klebsiella aerogenes]HCB2860460.1 hypothetical protein [Klebsiella aerogenes]HCB2865470.1 hypothetical protein [Klebsiella aerogenes]HCB2881679.1 hypothetical protein [Klebsiella aerogenes]HCB3346427.1 hypothetical protein [Klebsiella aerogenes]HCM1812528.1 hypothetical protein [Klebsiella aerogenes]
MYSDELSEPARQDHQDPIFWSGPRASVVPLDATRRPEEVPGLAGKAVSSENAWNDDKIYMAMAECGEMVDAMLSCNPERQAVLIGLGRELGVSWLAERSEFLRALKAEEWLRAARYLLDGDWAEQHYRRAWQYASVLIGDSQ